MSLTVFNKEYDGESIYDLDRDVTECLDGEYNPEADCIPIDEYGFQKGKFTVTITWSEE